VSTDLKCDGCGEVIPPLEPRGSMTWTTVRTFDLCMRCIGKARGAVWPWLKAT
jgi:hypothetical protein